MNNRVNATSTDSQQLGDEVLVQYRLAHLNMLQGVIGRMSGYSSSVKNFAVTIAAASLALAFDKANSLPLWIALGASSLFAILDAYYLSKEKGFRKAYERVARSPLQNAQDMAIKAEPAEFVSALASVSIWLFYIPLIAISAWMICGGIPR